MKTSYLYFVSVFFLQQVEVEQLFGVLSPQIATQKGKGTRCRSEGSHDLPLVLWAAELRIIDSRGV